MTETCQYTHTPSNRLYEVIAIPDPANPDHRAMRVCAEAIKNFTHQFIIPFETLIQVQGYLRANGVTVVTVDAGLDGLKQLDITDEYVPGTKAAFIESEEGSQMPDGGSPEGLAATDQNPRNDAPQVSNVGGAATEGGSLSTGQPETGVGDGTPDSPDETSVPSNAETPADANQNTDELETTGTAADATETSDAQEPSETDDQPRTDQQVA